MNKIDIIHLAKVKNIRKTDPIAHGHTEPISCRRVSNHSKNGTT